MGNDSGAFAILYAALIVTLIGIAALVVDLGTLRMDRRTDRAAVDSGVLAGSAKLGFGGTNPVQACQTAMRYVEVILGLPVGADTCADSPASGFQGDVAALCAAGTAGTPITAKRLAGDRTIFVTWPVPDNSTYLTRPDMERRGQTDTQALTAQDGSACSRLAVSIRHNRQAIFSAVWPDLGSARVTESRSVALATPDPGNGDLPAPLVVLEKRQCKALDATGGGSGTGGIVVNASAPLADNSRIPGFIQVDSAATAGAGENGFGGSCQAGGSAPINVPSNKVWALDGVDAAGTIVPGIIGSYALATGKAAYSDQTNVLACPALPGPFNPSPGATLPGLCRLPTAGVQVGAAPWVIRYNCGGSQNFGYVGGCPDRDPPAAPYPTPRNYVDQWRAYATGAVPTSFTTIPGGGITCNDASGTYGDLYVNCPNLKITGNLSVTGKFVATGNVNVVGCLMLNTTDVANCDTLPAAVSAPAPADGQNAYIGGELEVSGGFAVRQTFLYVGKKLSMNSTRAVSWVGPYGSGAAGAPACIPVTTASVGTAAPTPACFEDLTMWSPYNGGDGGTANRLTGNANLKVDGTLFMPAAYFTYNGQADNTQERAQFIARSLNITGGGLLTMTPDPSRSTPLPRSGGRLIR